jgi:hypothetical protein
MGLSLDRIPIKATRRKVLPIHNRPPFASTRRCADLAKHGHLPSRAPQEPRSSPFSAAEPPLLNSVLPPGTRQFIRDTNQARFALPGVFGKDVLGDQSFFHE